MKKYLLLITLVSGSMLCKSQDLDNIKKLVLLTQYDKAKPDLDSYLANEKNAAKPEGWYYKAYVYTALGRVNTKPVAESKSLFGSAFDAVKKYAELAPNAPLTTEEKNATVFNIYYGFYDLGVKTYNAKNFEESYNLFKKTLDVHDYIHDHNITGYQGLKVSAHDTDVVWNLVVLANELKKKDEAFVYSKRIADAGLSDEKYSNLYDELVLKYKREGNAELFSKYVTLAKKFYPVDKAYWEGQEIDFALKGLEDEALMNKYEELTQKFPDNYTVFYNYGVELDKFLGTSAATGKDIPALKQKLEDLYKKAISLNSTIEANLQLASLYYSRSYDAQEQAARIKGTKPDEVKLKNELIAKGKEQLNKCVPYAEAAVKMLAELKEYKYSDKANYKLALEILGNAAKLNGNAAKAAEYEKQKEGVDKL